MSGESKKSSQSLAIAVIASNNGTSSVDISNGLNEIRYYESILSDTRTATLVYVDSGGSVNGKSALDGLPITGGEKVVLNIKDLL